MVMHIPTQPGGKVQLPAMMNMNEARQPPGAWRSWVADSLGSMWPLLQVA